MQPRLLAFLILALATSACNGELALVGLIENNNYKTSGRSISGWALSNLNEQDCEPMRVFESKPVCRPREGAEVVPHCYQTLGAVTCYTQAHPTTPTSRLLPAPGQSR